MFCQSLGPRGSLWFTVVTGCSLRCVYVRAVRFLIFPKSDGSLQRSLCAFAADSNTACSLLTRKHAE